MSVEDDLEVGEASLSRRRQVEEKLRLAIVRGDFAPGEHLSDRALCELFKVSRTVVREAVRHLEAEGLVESFPNRGSFVRILTVAEAAQIFDVRAVLEAWATKKYVQRATDEQIEELVLELEALKASVARKDKIDLVDKKQEFYDTLFSVYRNTYVQTMLNQIQNWSAQLRAASMAAPDRLPNSVAALDRLIEAVRRRDEEDVWQASLDRVQGAAAAALAVLNERSSESSVGPSEPEQTAEVDRRRERYEAGLKVRREVLGRQYVDRALESADDFTRPMQDLVTEYCWGEIWTRKGLDRKTRSLLNLAMLTALNRPHEIELHVRGALNNGVTKREVAEVFLQAAVYCGVPAAMDSFRIARKVFDEGR